MQLCAGFILHFVAALAPLNMRNATVSHTPLAPKDCSGLSMLVIWEGPPSGGKGLHREGRASIGREGPPSGGKALFCCMRLAVARAKGEK